MDIPRSGNPLAIIAVLPAFLTSLNHNHSAGHNFVLAVYLGLTVIVMVLLKFSPYIRRTPLARIDETSLTFFGSAKSQQRSFQRCAISRIRLSSRPDFWRSSFRLAIVVDEETVNLWISSVAFGSVSTLRKALREQFPDEFEVAK